ncbi:nuclear transport factor 2 family protein [Streptomyces sp. NPDC057137]|uniref:nuclear transport factor 2 family protein n=1 Tax=Streptomyces sp. NPDC057137 TaxID=3346030 RepID=UPI00363CF3C5
MAVKNLGDFKALEAFFEIVGQGLDDLVDGGQFFEWFADDAVTEFVVTVPGYPKRIEGRDALAELYRGYGDALFAERADGLAVHHDRETSVVVLEYVVHGRVVATGRRYSNHFVSVITIRERKITHWRDYLDQLAVLDALGADVPARATD